MIPSLPISPQVSVPLVGLGTWQLKNRACTRTVQLALDMGYSHIDTAHLYNNHAAIGKAIKGIPRERIFLTSKFMLSQLDSSSVEDTCDQALRELKTDYLNLYLLHCPDRSASMEKSLLALEKLKEKGKILLTGVSNCTVGHLKDMFSWGFYPSINQVEFHPYLYQKALWEFCKNHQITLISYRTFGKGALIDSPLFTQIGSHYGKSSAQVLLRWCIEKNIPVIPKASSRKHLEENLQIFDFSLSEEDRHLLDTFPSEQRFCDGEWSDFNYP